MPLQEILQILTGKFTPRQLISYVIIQLTIFFSLLLTARILYPKENKYSVMTCTMSYLGSKDAGRNPKGWIFFGLATFQITLFDIPLMFYLFRYFRTFAPIGAVIALGLFIISTIAGFLVSIFPDTEREDHAGGDFIKDLRAGRIHNITAIITFLSYIMGNITFGLCYVMHPTQQSPLQWLPPFIFFILIIIGYFSTQLTWQWKCKQDPNLKSWPGDGIFSFPLWEWILFLSLYVFLFWNLYII